MSPILPLPYPVPPHCAICRSIACLNVVDNNEEGIVHRSSIYLGRKGFHYLHRQDAGKAYTRSLPPQHSDGARKCNFGSPFVGPCQGAFLWGAIVPTNQHPAGSGTRVTKADGEKERVVCVTDCWRQIVQKVEKPETILCRTRETSFLPTFPSFPLRLFTHIALAFLLLLPCIPPSFPHIYTGVPSKHYFA